MHIDTWDPEELLVIGAPLDEYDTEIREIYQALQRIDNIFELAKKIKSTFEQSFDIEYDDNDCFIVAEKIWSDINSNSH